MVPLTIKQFRALEWEKVYTYGDKKKGFETYGCPDFAGITITHEWKDGRVRRIVYQTFKRSTDSPAQVVKWWNQFSRAAAGGTQAAGSSKPAAAREGSVRGRGDQRPTVE